MIVVVADNDDSREMHRYLSRYARACKCVCTRACVVDVSADEVNDVSNASSSLPLATEMTVIKVQRSKLS